MDFINTLSWLPNLTSHISTSLPLFLLFIALTILLLLPLYNLTLHPLSSFPGPLLHRASPLPYALLLPSGRAPQHIYRLHTIYGPIVRIAPNHLSFTDPAAWRDMYGLHAPLLSTSPHSHPNLNTNTNTNTKGPGIENPKSSIWYRSLNPDDPHDLLNAPPEKHAMLRKALAVGFADRALKAQEGRIQRFVGVFVQKLGDRAARCASSESRSNMKTEGKGEGNVVDMVSWYNWVVFDIMGDLVFAEPFGCLEKERDHFFVELFAEMLRPGVVLVAMQYVGLGWAVPLILRWVGGRKALVSLKTELGRRVRGRIAKGEVVDDLFEGLLKHREEWGMSMDELEGTAHIVVAAGSETTPTALSGATNLLLRNPEKMERLKREIRSTFRSDEEITMASVSRLPYLQACLNESLRMFPPATHGMVREASEGGTVVAGSFVPAGTLIECQIWSMNFSPLNWTDPSSFQPERFLHGQGENASEIWKGDNVKALQPFQYGPRDCIGRK